MYVQISICLHVHTHIRYKALDIAAGAHFSLAVVVNVSGPGCTEDGLQTGVACVRQNVRNGLT